MLECVATLPSETMQEVVRTIRRIAPGDVAVLITGEGGVGKEIIANLIHAHSGRPYLMIKPFCEGLAPEQLEQEYAEARTGTMFLRDLCELPVPTQVKLFSLIEQQYSLSPETATPGGTCRIIAATRRDPQEAIRTGKLYQSLYYRLSAICLHLPPLRERPEDILPLARTFLKRAASEANRTVRDFTPAAVERLTSYSWPANLNDLEREVVRAALLVEGDVIDVADLSIPAVTYREEAPEETSFTLLEDVERRAIIKALREVGGNKVEAAKRLGIGRQTLYNKIRLYKIEG
jgi:DNA-binding NtrC family response regulator